MDNELICGERLAATSQFLYTVRLEANTLRSLRNTRALIEVDAASSGYKVDTGAPFSMLSDPGSNLLVFHCPCKTEKIIKRTVCILEECDNADAPS
jgi:hypothetical protein